MLECTYPGYLSWTIFLRVFINTYRGADIIPEDNTMIKTDSLPRVLSYTGIRMSVMSPLSQTWPYVLPYFLTMLA